jgi:MFS family permease
MSIISSPSYRWYIFAMCGSTYVISGFWRVSNAVIAGDLAHDLALSPEVLGLMGGAFFYSFGLAQLPMGPLLDRFGPRIVISLLTCIGAPCAVLFAMADSGNRVTLTEQERKELETLTKRGKTHARRFIHARALLLSDAGTDGRSWSVADKAVELNFAESVSHMTVQRVLKKTNLSLISANN